MTTGYRHSWDAQSNQDLLIAMYETLSPGAEQIRCIVERTKAMGYTFTAKAVQYLCFPVFFSNFLRPFLSSPWPLLLMGTIP